MHTKLSVRDFAAELASGAPVPGGGAAAAVAGALAAALASMVCQFTVGRRRYQTVDAEFRALLSRADAIRMELLELAEEDAAAYESVVEAQKAAKDESITREDAEHRLQSALARAVHVPLRCAVLSADVLALCEPIAERGNRHLVSDAGVAALLADAAVNAAALNVRANLPQIRDEKVRSESESALARLLSSTNSLRPRVMNLVQSKMA